MGNTIKKETKPYNYVAHSLEDDKFHQRIVMRTKNRYDRKKEKRVDLKNYSL